MRGLRQAISIGRCRSGGNSNLLHSTIPAYVKNVPWTDFAAYTSAGLIVTKSDHTKAEHKSSATGVSKKGSYEETAFGRRRISRRPKALVLAIWLIVTPIAFVYRRLRRSRNV